MFKITRQDLQTKTDAQLSALFKQAQRTVGGTPHLSEAFRTAQAATTIIRREIQSRLSLQ